MVIEGKEPKLAELRKADRPSLPAGKPAVMQRARAGQCASQMAGTAVSDDKNGYALSCERV